MIHMLKAIGLTPSSSSTVHTHKQYTEQHTLHKQLTNWEECGSCPVFASYTLGFALQPRKKRGKTSVGVSLDSTFTVKLNDIGK